MKTLLKTWPVPKRRLGVRLSKFVNELWWYVTRRWPVSSDALLSEWPTRETLKWSWIVFHETVTKSPAWLTSTRPS